MAKGDKTTANGTIGVLLGHRHALLKAALSTLIQHTGFELVGAASTLDDLRTLTKERLPDLILLDWKMDDATVEGVRSLSTASPDTGIAILLEPENLDEFFPAMEAGVNGYLSKGMDEETFADSLRLVARGEVVISREMAESLAQRDSQQDVPAHDHLTGRETQILGMVGQGATNREIAESLTIAENTAKVHLRNVLDKLNLRNRQQAAAYAAEQGIKPEIVAEVASSD